MKKLLVNNPCKARGRVDAGHQNTLLLATCNLASMHSCHWACTAFIPSHASCVEVMHYAGMHSLSCILVLLLVQPLMPQPVHTSLTLTATAVAVTLPN